MSLPASAIRFSQPRPALLIAVLAWVVLWATGLPASNAAIVPRMSRQDLAGGEWRFRVGDDLAWADPGFDDSGWERMQVGQGLFGIGGGWGEQGHPGYYGFGWYRHTFDLHASVARMPRIVLHIDHPTEDVWSYLNGHLLGSTFTGPQDDDVPSAWIRPTANFLVVRVLCHGNEHFEAPRYESCGLTDGVRLEGSSTTRRDIPLTVSTDRLGNITEPGHPMTFTARVINTTNGTETFRVGFTAAYRYGGAGTGLDERRTLELSSGRGGTVTAAFTSDRRGPYALRVTLSDQRGSITSSTLGFGVADPPGPPDDRFGGNVVLPNDVAASVGSDRYVDMELAARSGARWMREHLQWMYVQQEPNLWNWSTFDAIRDESRRTGIHVLWLPLRAPYWSQSFLAPTTAGALLSGEGEWYPPDPPHYQAFARFLNRAAARYPGNHWEVWNEEDGFIPRFGTVKYRLQDHLAYLDMLTRADRAIAVADPSATVVLGGLADPVNPRFQEAFIDRDGTLFPTDTFFDKLAKSGGASHFAVTNFHVYKPDSHDTSVADVAEQVRDKMTKYGFGNQPLWITETNAGDNPSTFEASRTYCARNIVEALAGGVDRVFWWNTIDYPGESPTLQLGLFSSTGQPRPAFFSFLTTTRMLAGLPHIEGITVDGVPAYRFSGGSRTVTVVWDDSGKRIDIGAGVTAFDDFGNPLPTSGRLKLGRNAVFLVAA